VIVYLRRKRNTGSPYAPYAASSITAAPSFPPMFDGASQTQSRARKGLSEAGTIASSSMPERTTPMGVYVRVFRAFVAFVLEPFSCTIRTRIMRPRSQRFKIRRPHTSLSRHFLDRTRAPATLLPICTFHDLRNITACPLLDFQPFVFLLQRREGLLFVVWSIAEVGQWTTTFW
jgi:hypothetical protein